MSSLNRFGFLALALLGAACHGGSSSPVPPSTQFATNLGFSGTLRSGGNPGVVGESEGEHGDLNGDGDAVDQVVYLLEQEAHRTTNTGLVLGFGPFVYQPPGPFDPPSPIACYGPTLAFGVSEGSTGGLDRNGDGDFDDVVLAYYDRASASVRNVGLAVTFVTSSENLLAFDVARIEEDDGSYVTEPFVHDLRSGESWSLGPVGALDVLQVAGDFVALRAHESVLGDLTNDGDETDDVAAFYDVRTRTLQLSDVTRAFGLAAHRGRWILSFVDDVGTSQLVVHDPATGTSRRLEGFGLRAVLPGVAPIVLVSLATQPPTLWLYDVDTDALTNPGLAGYEVAALGGRLVILVDERAQGEDLDRNGELASLVPVVYDPATGATENLGIAGSVQPIASGLLIPSPEFMSGSDWNGDGDLDDRVLFTWDEESGALVNTRLATTLEIGRAGERFALLALDEDTRTGDLNGDGDACDSVLHAYDIGTRRLTNLGLAVFRVPSSDGQALFSVGEASQGQDLNGDGDLDDGVLFETDLPLGD